MTVFNNDFVAGLDWAEIGTQLDQEGYAILPGLLDKVQASSMAALIGTPDAVHRMPLASRDLGRGDVFFLTQALPEPLGAWRAALYERLSIIANRWHEVLGIEERFPVAFNAFQEQNKKVGQMLAQSHLSRLGEQDYLALHQGAEGASVFPLQLVVLLSEPGEDFTGGEFVMTEQRPRMQSRPMVLPLHQGDAAIITVAQRPFKGRQGCYRVNIRHAISRVRSGERIGLEVFF